MSGILATFLDSKLRNARKLAKLRLKEARKLVRRAKGNVSNEALQEIGEGQTAVAEALTSGKAAKINKTAERLDELLEKHVGIYRKSPWRESTESIVIAVLVALLLRSFVVEAFKIPSGSMIPTLAIGDQIFVNKYIYGVRIPFTPIRLVNFGLPERGEVIVFICPVPPNDDYIKRVIGLPGNQIEVRHGVIYINGEPVPQRRVGTETFADREQDGSWSRFTAEVYEEKLGDHTYTVLHDAQLLQPASDHGPVIVPEGHLFMMGDNRDHSFDSRQWGTVPQENVLGRSLFVWWSWGKDGLAVGRLGTWIE